MAPIQSRSAAILPRRALPVPDGMGCGFFIRQRLRMMIILSKFRMWLCELRSTRAKQPPGRVNPFSRVVYYSVLRQKRAFKIPKAAGLRPEVIPIIYIATKTCRKKPEKSVNNLPGCLNIVVFNIFLHYVTLVKERMLKSRSFFLFFFCQVLQRVNLLINIVKLFIFEEYFCFKPCE